MVAGPRNQFEMLKAGTQDSGLFFCASYEYWIVVFLASPAVSAGFRTRWSSPGSRLQLLPILLIHKDFWAAYRIPVFRFGKKSVFLAVFESGAIWRELRLTAPARLQNMPQVTTRFRPAFQSGFHAHKAGIPPLLPVSWAIRIS